MGTPTGTLDTRRHFNMTFEREDANSTCFYGDRLTFGAVAHEVGGYHVGCVVGAAL